MAVLREQSCWFCRLTETPDRTVSTPLEGEIVGP